MNKLRFFLCLTLILPVHSMATHARIPIDQDAQSEWGKGREIRSITLIRQIELSEVLNGVMSGIEYEDESNGLNLAFLKEVQKLERYSRGRMTRHERELYTGVCNTPSSKAHLFCDFLNNKKQKLAEKKLARANKKKFSRTSVREAQYWIEKTDLEQIRSFSDDVLIKGVRAISRFPMVTSLAAKLIQADECFTPGFLYYTASKLEESFPLQEYQTLARGIYQKIIRCYQEDYSYISRYRLSLISIWNDECDQAEPLLADICEKKIENYYSRAIYWRQYCAQQSGKKKLAQDLQIQLMTEFPLSYHGLLLSGGKAKTVAPNLNQVPMVSFRSQKHPTLNTYIRAVEVLQDLNAWNLSVELLDYADDHAPELENAVRLYLGVLYDRGGETLRLFRALSRIFRDQPEQISMMTLKLFYPLKHFDVMKNQPMKLDPYLVAAIIRQESGFNRHARSPAGAIGLMQLMPRTARMMERRVSRQQLLDPKTNIRVGVKFFEKLVSRFHGDAELALAAYNAGPEKLDEWINRYPTDNRMLFFDLIPYRETRDYVAMIARNYYWYLSLYSSDGIEKFLSPQTQEEAKNRVRFTIFQPTS